MQQLSRDLSHQIRIHYGNRSIIRPPTHIHLGDASLIVVGLMLRFISRAKLSVTACGLDIVYQRGWYQWMIRTFLKRANTIVCISHATAEEVRKRGVPEDRIVVIPCGIDDERVPDMAPADPDLIVTVGRLIPRKGVAWFIEHALPIVRAAHPKVRYVIIGSGPEESRILQTIERTGQSSYVELKTECGDRERDDIVAHAAIFVAPNIPVPHDMEGFGIVCLEASNHGIPVIAARLEGLQDAVVEGETGLFFEPLNAKDCADKMNMVFGRADDCSIVINKIRARFGWSKIFPLYQKHVFER
jgi:phosphatidylinositol alpha-1,6-mannosyltransferase